jgi:hypothetical protein
VISPVVSYANEQPLHVPVYGVPVISIVVSHTDVFRRLQRDRDLDVRVECIRDPVGVRVRSVSVSGVRVGVRSESASVSVSNPYRCPRLRRPRSSLDLRDALSSPLSQAATPDGHERARSCRHGVLRDRMDGRD